MVKMDHFVELMFYNEDGEAVATPGTSYDETLSDVCRIKIDFSKFDSVRMRVVVTAQGDEAGNNKGIEVYDVTGAAQLCEVEWNGNTLQVALAGSWTAQNSMTVDSELTVRFKASSGTESLTVYRVELQIMYT